MQNTTLSELELQSLKQPKISVLTQVQPHGVLLVLAEPTLEIIQVSRNTSAAFGRSPEAVLGMTLEDLFDPYQVEQFQGALNSDRLERVNPIKVWVRREGDEFSIFDGVFHRSADGLLVLELEPALTQENIPFLGFYHLAKTSVSRLSSTTRFQDFCQIIVEEIRKVTGFERVKLYQFHEDGHGEVLAEDRHPEMDSYLGLHFPESDVPQPAREMFLANWIRIIPDATAKPVELYPAINPQTETPVDLTLSILRSPYQCHLEYLKNMGVQSSLTISLMQGDKLWGLIACHHRTPKAIPYELRKACEFLGRLIFSEIANREADADQQYRLYLAQVRSHLVETMTSADNFLDGLLNAQPSLLSLAGATGAAVCFNGHWQTLGLTPSERELEYLLQWLKAHTEQDVFYTDSLPSLYSDGERFKEIACGMLAIAIARQSYVIWFRPEVIQTVNWGGDPNQAYSLVNEAAGTHRLCPRQSFELWKETVRLKCLSWQPVEIKAALELRKGIINVVLRQAEELALLAQDLQRSNAELKKFAYVASHDLQEPLNQVANYVELLKLRYDEALDNDAKEFIDFAVSGVNLMQTLIDDVLAYSKVDLQGIVWELTDLEEPLQRALNSLQGRIDSTRAKITCDPLPSIVSDGTQIMLLFQNLLGNAIKFRREKETPEIHIGVSRLEEHWEFAITDNGIGLDMEFCDRIFVIFQRLHTRDEYPGSGMGLAICKKIVDC
ncbi:MAG: ATP-binding protein, partial [Cyanobacteria bacterium P01_H01_bin.15]